MTGRYGINATWVERVARYVWISEGGSEADWERHQEVYRIRARKIMGDPDGYKDARMIRHPRNHEPEGNT
jgi:hypothetical protein